MKALIDTDILCYEIGAVAEQVIWECDGTFYETKTEAKRAGCQEADLVRHVHPIKWPFVKKMIDDRIAGILKAVNATSYQCYLTGKGNFREKVATVTKYKGTRSGEKPYHFLNIRNYLKEKYDAEEVCGIEADDAISIAQYNGGGDTVICSRDKDLRMVPGYHYSWGCGERQPEKPLYEISELEGWYNWAKQMLTGDTIDNIVGVVGIGEKKAEKILSDAKNKEELVHRVAVTYNEVYGTDPIRYQSWEGVWVETNWFGLAEEMHKLLWMLRGDEEWYDRS